jgi:hypothetical protein
MQQTYDVTEAQNVMREILAPEVRVMYQQTARGWELIPDGTADFVHDKGAEWVVGLEPNPSLGGMGSSQKLFPRGSTGRRKRMKVVYATHAISRRLDKAVLHTDRESIVKGVGPLVKEDTETFFHDLNRLFWGNGDGAMAEVSAGPAASAVITMTGPRGVQHLRKRGLYNIVDPALGTKRTVTIGGVPTSNLFMVAKNQAADTASFADDEADAAADAISATTIVPNDIVVYKDSWNLAPKGIRYHLNNDSGTYQNLSRATHSDTIVPPVKDMLNGPLTVAAMDFVETQVIYKKGTAQSLDGLFWAFPPTQQYAYRALGYNTDTKVVKRAGMGDMKIDLGYTVIEHNGRAIWIDVDCPSDDGFLMDRTSFCKFMAKSAGVVQDDGQTLRMIPAFDSSGVGTFSAEYFYAIDIMVEIANKDIQNNGRLKNLAWQGLPTGQF